MAHLQPIVDSHVHLWPASAANSDGHGWMNEGEPLTKQHILSDYRRAAKQDTNDGTSPRVKGIVYLETDRRLGDTKQGKLQEWAYQPSEEIKFLRSIVEKQYGDRDSQMLLGLVPWAPLHQGTHIFEEWFKHAELTAGVETWRRVKGFRFLLQAITDQSDLERLVLSPDFISILKSFRSNGRNFSFDVGVDQHSGGVWQLETVAKAVELVHAGVEEDRKTTFILNHLCKPDLTEAPKAVSEEDFARWRACIKRFSASPHIYMKLSGSFSELSSSRVSTTSATEIAERMRPWLDHLFACFPPHRIMFGSDWPVCNVRGPAGEDSWPVWREVVQAVLDQRQLSEEDQALIWSGTAASAYRLQV